jgi:4-amino-4-deoxy-L-arabinose transferase-like glycosyltransferase
MTMPSKFGILIVFILALAASSIFALYSFPLEGKDALQYNSLARNVYSGHGFSLNSEAPYIPTMFREPMYPLFLAAVYTVFGYSIKFAIMVQMMLHALTALLAYGIAKEIFTQKIAFLSALAVAVFPTLASMSAYLMSETFFTFILCLAAYIFIKAAKEWKAAYFLAAGAVFGTLILTKTITLLLPAVMVLCLLILNVKRRMIWKQVLLCVVAFVISCSIIVGIWSVRNEKLFGTYALVSIRGGEVMWSRAEKIDDSPREIMASVCCSFSEFAAKKLFPDMIGDSGRYLYKDLGKATVLELKYAEEGKTPVEIDKILRSEAFSKIAKHPLQYLAYTFVEGIKMTAFTYLPILNEEAVKNYFSGIKNGIVILSGLKGAMRMMAYPILIMFLLGIVKNLRIWDRWFPIFTIIVYINLIYSLMDAIGRYGIPLIPFYCIFAVACLYKPIEAAE